ncbi:MAG TPA: GGDEF domain-containing protein [Candidatus Sulfomarinibacteraceae bacterium]|nr:GGDEF domain-containing protein [Candidatus Sulfomarinibacteraceae bacterium]
MTWPVATTALVVAVPLLLLVIGVLWSQLRSARAQPVPTPQQLNGVRDRSTRRLERDLEGQIEFFQVFSSLLGELHAQRQIRQIPQILVNAMVRMFRPESAVVAIRRRSTMTDPDRENRLIVSAVSSSQRRMKVGMEVRFGEGQLGIVAARQRVMVRREFDEERSLSYSVSQASGQPEFDVVAPMIASDGTLGVIAIARPERHHVNEKEMLEMMARLGTLTWTNLEAYKNVEIAAEVDGLTGIYNKSALLSKLSTSVLDARERGDKVSVFLFDIDNFKVYNDNNGHLVGDQLLRLLAKLVKDSVRSDDTFGRFGGEEFVLVMPGRSGPQALSAAEVIRNRIEEYPFQGEAGQPTGRVTISGGVACFPDDADDSVELLRNADVALYEAKNAGRNRVFRAEPTGLNPVAGNRSRSGSPDAGRVGDDPGTADPDQRQDGDGGVPRS